MGDVAIELKPLPFGNYYLLERLAVGGMAEVYLAKCFGVAGFERLVALKRILPTIAEDDEFIAMFIDEAKIAGQLSHDNIAQIFDLGKINNSYFIAMEYISGHDLRALWDRAREQGGLPLALACYVTQKICDGLDYAHRRRDNRGRPLGIIHRDVSPQNVLLSYDGDIKVIDFGIAKAANRMVRTQTGILKGKFAYMAPEQARGEPTDHRADIFAIGVILYELVTGERAFRADSDFALLEKVRRVDIVPPRKVNPAVPRELERIIYKALAKDAADRYAWASALSADLDRFMTAHDLAYNKGELAAYVRRAFKVEYQEETRRLKLYQTFKPDGDDGGPAADEIASAEVEAPSDSTQLRADLSASDASETGGTAVAPKESAEASTHYAGDDASDDLEATQANVPASGETFVDLYKSSEHESEYEYGSEDGEPEEGFDAAYTLSGEALPLGGAGHGRIADDEPDDVTSTDADRVRRRASDLALVSSSEVQELPWKAPRSARRASDAGLAEQRTQVSISRPDFSEEGGFQEGPTGDATMVDSFSVPSSDEKSGEKAGAHALPVAKSRGDGPSAGRREGTRSDIRSSSLREAVRAGAQERGRRRSEVEGPLLSMPHLVDDELSSARRCPATRNGTLQTALASDGRQGRPEHERFDTSESGFRPRPADGQPSAPVAATVAGGLAVGLVVGALMLGLVLFLVRSPAPNTFIVVSPSPATVRLGEEVLCDKTPCAVHLEEGRHELLFSGADFDLLSKSVNVGRDELTIVDVAVRPRRVLRVETTPPGAKVWLDGKPIDGETPLSLPELTLGDKVRLKIAKKGYDTLEELVEVPDVADGAWRFDLLASRTKWEVTVKPADAVLDTGGRRLRKGQITVSVPRGETRVVVAMRPGCETDARPLLGNGRPTDKMTLELSCQSFDGRLSVGSARRAEIDIDGVPTGETTPLRDYPIPAGPHVVVLRRRGRAEPFGVQVPAGDGVVLNTHFR